MSRLSRGASLVVLIVCCALALGCALKHQLASSQKTEEEHERLGPHGKPLPRAGHPGDAAAFRNLSLQDENGVIADNGLIAAHEHINAMKAAAAADPEAGAGITRNGWTWVGPGNIGGRIRAIAIHPTTPATMLAGSVGGGIWRTTDGGSFWAPVDDFMANLAVSSIIFTPGNPNVVYAGTGEGFYNGDALRGAGVFKSTDGGVTWNQLASTTSSSWHYVNRLAISPAGATILAATRGGIFRSTDAGGSWTQALATEMMDIQFDPADSSKATASGFQSRAYYSTNGGASWTQATGITSGGRVETAYAPSSPNIVYASVDTSSGAIFRSIDGGVTYSLRSNTGYLASQGWYDNALWVNPQNPEFIIVGGVDLYRSTNGGTSLTRISSWSAAPISAHADHHVIVSHPDFNNTTNKTVFFGNDGGVYRATDVSTLSQLSGWQHLNNSLGVTQFYGGAGHAASGKLLGGTQDNGTLMYTPAAGVNGWVAEFGGDGGWSAIDPNNANNLYGEYVYMSLHRSLTGNAAGADWINGISNAGGCKPAPYTITDSCSGGGILANANFIAPFILDPRNSNRLLAGGIRLWRTNDATTPNTSSTGPSWSIIKASVGSNISAIAVAPLNSDIIWVGHNNGDVYSTANGTAASPAWTRRDLASPALPNRFVTRITVDPRDSNIVYVTFGGFNSDNIYRTMDGGANWSVVTGSGLTALPSAPVRDLEVNPDNSAWLYAATEVGVFTSADAGATWTLPQDGPANVSVDELFFMGVELVAVTHGRGMFKHPITNAALSVSATQVSPGGPMTTTLTNGGGGANDWIGLFPAGGSNASLIDWVRVGSGVSNRDWTIAAPAALGSYEFRLFAPGYVRMATSPTFTVSTVSPAPSISAISPASVAAGSSGLSLTVTGTGFINGSIVRINGSNRTTTYASSTQLLAAITTGDLASQATHAITVFTPAPGGGTSGSVNLSVVAPPPAPTLTAISPTTAAAGASPLTLVVTGTSFDASSVVRVDGNSRPTVFNSATQLTATLPASDRATGTRSITVFTPAPGGGTSSAATLTLTGPALAVSSSSVNPGAMITTTLTNGTGGDLDWIGLFAVGAPDSSLIDWVRVGAGLATRTWSIAAPATLGNYEFRLFAPGMVRLATSPAVTVANLNPRPVLSSISPATAIAGPSAFTLTVNGSAFRNNSVVRYAGADRVTTFVSSTQLTAVLLTGDVSTAGSYGVTAFTPTPGGGTSDPVNLVVSALVAAPTLTSISPSTTTAGVAPLSLTVTGTNFFNDSVVQVDGVDRPTVFSSSTQLTATLPPSDRAVGTRGVRVRTPGGGLSAGLWLTVSGPTLTASPETALPGATVTANLSGGTGGELDWIGLFLANTPDSAVLDWVRIGSGITTRTWSITAPSTVGVYEFRVFAPGMIRLATRSFNISTVNRVAVLSSLSPATALTAASGFTLTVNGAHFRSDSIVSFGGSPLITTFASSTQLTASVPASSLLTAGSHPITVWTPLVGTSEPINFVVSSPAPAPTLTSISPTTSTASINPLTLIATGTNFVATSIVRVDGVARPTTFNSATQLTATLSGSDRATGTRSITVFTPAPGGGTSSAATLTLTGPSLGVSPATINPGGSVTTTLTNGAGGIYDWIGLFPVGGADAATIDWVRAGEGVTTRSWTIAAPATPGSYEFRLFAPGYVRLATSPSFTVGNVNPLPVISSITPTTVVAGSAGFTLAVNGSGFTVASRIRVAGTAQTTTFVAASQLTAAIDASTIAASDALAITVETPAPGGGTSNAVTFTVVAASAVPALTHNQATVTQSSNITATLTNGTGGIFDWIGLFPAGGSDDALVDWVRVGAGVTTRSWTTAAPSTIGSYEFRLYAPGYVRLATSAAFTVIACTDTDGDRLCDIWETGTNVYVSATNTGTSPSAVDTDGDGLRDGDEVLGTSAGLNLPAMGANPLKKNLLLEYDWFDDNSEPGSCVAHSHRPPQAVLDRVTASFAASPVTNPDGTTGIAVIHDYGQGGMFTGGNLVPHGPDISGGINNSDFAAVKSGNFAANRAGYFHYVVMPHYYSASYGSSGQAELPGNDMIVSLGCFTSTTNVANTIMHELGHNLGLRHGGNENCNWKPNYNSVMNYRFQFPGVDTSCNAVGSSGESNTLDFSRGTRISLNESNLNENAGVCGATPIDWNFSGSFTSGLSYDLNRTSSTPNASTSADSTSCSATLQTLTDYNDWANLWFAGIGDSDGTTLFGWFLELFQEETVCRNPAMPAVIPAGMRPQ